MTRIELIKLRALIEKAVESLPDEEALEGVTLFPDYQVGHAYAVDDRFKYEGQLYRVVQAHTSQADWIPSEVPALYVKVAIPGTIPEWEQPLGFQDAYHTGDKVMHNGKIWESTIDNNVWEPGVYGWIEVL